MCNENNTRFTELDINEKKPYIDEAKKDFIIHGFDLTKLNVVERQIFLENYIDENSLSNFYLARERVKELKSTQITSNRIVSQWGFPNSGRYLGFVLACTEKKDKNQYILSFLISNNLICLSKFKKSIGDIVYTSITSFFDIKDNIFGKYDFSRIPIFPAEIIVENIILKNDKSFSVIKSLRPLKNDESKILIKVANIILRQSCFYGCCNS